MKTIDYIPLKNQATALKYLFDNKTNQILYGGGIGGGKSELGCVWIITSALKYPGTRWLIGRSKLTNLKQTTMKSFRDILKKFGLKNDVDYNWPGNSNEIKFANGSEIIMKDLFSYPSDPEFDSLGSIEITGAFLDEVQQISTKAKDIVSTRLRYKLTEYNLIGKILMTCNPSHNFAYTQFYKPWKEGTLDYNKAFIKALPGDNYNLPEGYIESLNLDPISTKRLVYGEWDYEDEGSLFKFENILNAYNYPILNLDNKFYCSIDPARLGKDKTSIFIWKGLELLEVVVINKATITDQYKVINELLTKYKIPNNKVVIDSDGVGGGLCDMIKGCQQIMNNGSPFNKENYQNLKTQLYFKLAELINNNQIDLSAFTEEQQQTVIEELQVVKREDIDKDGKLKITSKEQIKQKIGRSPDFADNLAYRMYFIYKSGAFSFGF